MLNKFNLYINFKGYKKRYNKIPSYKVRQVITEFLNMYYYLDKDEYIFIDYLTKDIVKRYTNINADNFKAIWYKYKGKKIISIIGG